MKHMDTTPVRRTLSTAMAIALFLAGTSVGAMPPSEPLGAQYIDGGEVWWDPKPGNHDQLVLTVSTPSGEVIEKSFPAGSPPFFATTEDGTYSFELYRVPRGVAVSAGHRPDPGGPIDANGRFLSATEGFVPPAGRRGPVQSGSFSVVDGSPVDPSVEE